jgi:hypothetical protein
VGYYRNRWYPKRRYNQQSTNSDLTRSSSYQQSWSFVRSSLFKFDEFKFELFAAFYGKKYGDGAKQYLCKAHRHWRSGTTKMRRETEKRILSCVPPFLDKPDQFKLLSFQIPSIVEQQKNEIRSYSIPLSQLSQHYKNLAKKIIDKEYRLDWFINTVFPDQEVVEFINVLRFTMVDCLRQSYAQVREDIATFHQTVPQIDASVRLTYSILLLSCHVNIDTFELPSESQLDIVIPTPRLVTEFKDFYRKYLLEHALAQSKQETVSAVNRQFGITDFRGFIAQLEKMRSDQEYDSTLQIMGHGGTVSIHLQRKNLTKLNLSTVKYVLMLLAVGIVALGLITALSHVRRPGMAWLLIIFPIGAACALWSKITETRSEAKEYERRRRARITTS